MRELIPWVGDRSTLKRIRELEKEAGTLPVIFSLFFFEFLKTLSLAIPRWFRWIPIPNIIIPNWFIFLAAAALIGWMYVYEDERREYVEKGKDKAKETAEGAKDKAKDVADTAKEKTGKDS